MEEACPYPCSDAELPSSAPGYMREATWQALIRAAKQGLPIKRAPRLEGIEWDVVNACLRWHPKARKAMPELLRMPWLCASAHAPRGGDADRPAARGSAVSVVCASAEEPPPMLTPAERRQRHMAAPLLRLSEDYQRRKVSKSSSTCHCAGNCRHWKHRQDGGCSNKWLMEGYDYCATCVCDIQVTCS